jgi:tetratricopeptide (TPR) repeat protein
MAQLRAAQREGDPELRAAAALRAADVLAKRYGPDAPGVQVCIDEAALTLAMSDHADRAVELTRRSNAVRDAIPVDVRDPLLHASSHYYLGWFLSLAGRHEEAVQTYQMAIEEFAAALGAEHHTIALARGGMAYSLAELGQLDRADALSAQALALAQRLEATPYDQLAAIEFERGHVLKLLGRPEEALPLLSHAWTDTMSNYPPSYGWRRVLIGDMVDVSKARHDDAEAARWYALLDRPDPREPRIVE